jgi:hypothetical protein
MIKKNRVVGQEFFGFSLLRLKLKYVFALVKDKN